jgi:hypothetical protein
VANGADLTGVRRKLARAKKDLDALQVEIAAYLDTSPVRLVEESESKNRYAIRSFIDRPPDAEWGVDIGIIGDTARGCLDALVKQLIIDSGNDPEKCGRYQFPIFTSYKSYIDGGNNSNRNRMLKGVVRKHRKVIDHFQPYHRGSRASDDPLAILQAVTNRHKHDDPHTVIAMLPQAEFRIMFPDGYGIDIRRGANHPEPLEHDQWVFAVEDDPPPGVPPSHGIKLAVDHLPVDLYFEGRKLVRVIDLDRSILQCTHIVERFSSRITP